MFYYLRTLVAWRRFIAAGGLVAGVIGIVVSLLLPKWYTATTSVFPPEPKTAVSPFAQLLQNLQAPLLGPTAIGARPGTVYIDILLSRRLGEKIVEEFDLKKVYGCTLMKDALDALHSHTFISLLENGILKISFEDRDPERAAAVANRYVELLDEFNRELNVSRASYTRKFIEEQLEGHRRELRAAEEKLKRFQEKNQAVELDEQTKSVIELVSTLTSRAVALEVELKLLGKYASSESEEYKRKKGEYDEILHQLARFKSDTSSTVTDEVRTFFPTLVRVPDLALAYARLLRDVKVEEKVYELLVTQYENARIEEARNTPTVQILDPAKVPEIRSRPRRKRMVIVSGFLGLAWASVLSLVVTIWRDGRGGQLREVLAPVGRDLGRIFRWRKP